MNRHAVSNRKHSHRRIPLEQEPKPSCTEKYSSSPSYATKLTDSRTPLDSTFIRTVSKDDHSLGSRFEPPVKKYRSEGRDDASSVASQSSRGSKGSRGGGYGESSVTDQSSRGRKGDKKYSGSNHTSKAYRNPTMKSYRTLSDLIRGAYENRGDLVSSSIAAFWTRAALLLEEENEKSHHRDNTKHLYEKVKYFLRQTERLLDSTGSNNMSQTLTAMGKIYKQGRRGSPYQVMFYDIVVGNGVTDKDSIFLKIANVAVHKLDRYDPQALSTTAITFARIGVAPILDDGSSLFDSIAYFAMKKMRDFNPQGLSTLVWAFATVQVAHKSLFQRVSEAAQSILHRFNPQNLSNLAWAFAKTNQSEIRLFSAIASESLKYISSPDSCPQNISNSLWSFSTAEIYDRPLFEASARRMIDYIEDFNAQELANSASAFASFGDVNHVLFKAIGDEASRKLDTFTPQNCANLLHAFASSGVSHPRLFDRVAAEAMLRLDTFNPQELANLAWSCAKAKEVEPRLFTSIAKETLDRLDEFVEPQHLSNLVWAFATAKLPHKPLFEAVADVVIKRKEDFSPQQVSNIIWAYSFIPIGSVNQDICRRFESVVFKSIGACDSQFFANVAWSYAVANVDAPFLFGKNSQFIRTILSRQQEFNLEALCQLHQFILWRKELRSEVPFPSSFQKLCYNAYIAREPSPSAFQDYVMDEMKSIGLQPQEEYLTSIGYSLDALVEVNGKQVGIEVDGPFHFAGRGKPLGKMTLKHRQVLNVAGIRIVSVPYWEWEGCVDKQEYLRSKLNIAQESYDEFKWVL